MVSSWDQKTGRSGHFSDLDGKAGQDRVQEAFKTAQDGPKTPPRLAKTGQDAHKTGQDAPRTLPRHLQNGFKTTQDAPKTTQDGPRRREDALRPPNTRFWRSKNDKIRQDKTRQDNTRYDKVR